LDPHVKKKKIQKIKKYIFRRKQKKSVRRIGCGSSKIQRLKFNSILLTDESPVDKENLI